MGIKCVAPQESGAVVHSRKKPRCECDTPFESRYTLSVLYDSQMQLSVLIMVAIGESKKNLQSHKRNLIMKSEGVGCVGGAAECEPLVNDKVTGP